MILLTGQPRLETAIQAVESGALRYLQKPVPTAEILEAVDIPEETSLFVNVHSLELEDDDLYGGATPLTDCARLVVLEVTERGRIESVPDLHSRISRLRALGYRIAVDDFGAGYAALNSFATLHPDVAKLDMALVRGVDHDRYRQQLIASVRAMCRDLDILVVAEGIETEAERAAVVDLGCDLLQGFLIGRPLPLPAQGVLTSNP